MKDILTAPFMVEMIRTVTEMYRHGWDERNGGNVSVMLSEAQIAPYVCPDDVKRVIPTGFDASARAGCNTSSRRRETVFVSRSACVNVKSSLCTSMSASSAACQRVCLMSVKTTSIACAPVV